MAVLVKSINVMLLSSFCGAPIFLCCASGEKPEFSIFMTGTLPTQIQTAFFHNSFGIRIVRCEVCQASDHNLLFEEWTPRHKSVLVSRECALFRSPTLCKKAAFELPSGRISIAICSLFGSLRLRVVLSELDMQPKHDVACRAFLFAVTTRNRATSVLLPAVGRNGGSLRGKG